MKFSNDIHTIGVIGHSKIDVDSYVSSLLLCRVLNFLGYSGILMVPNNNEGQILKLRERINRYLEFPYPFEDIPHRSFSDNANSLSLRSLSENGFVRSSYNLLDGVILVDHNLADVEIQHNCKIIGKIDHHRAETKLELLPIEVILKASSAAILVYRLFKDEYAFSDTEKVLVAMATAFDTVNGTSSKFYNEDEIKELPEVILPMPEFEYLDPLENFKIHKCHELVFESTTVSKFGPLNMTDYDYLFLEHDNLLLIIADLKAKTTSVKFRFNDETCYWDYDYLASRAVDVVLDALTMISPKK